MSTTVEHREHLEIDTDADVFATIFTANGEYLVCGTVVDVRVWRVKNGERVATMPVDGGAFRVAVSRDGKWIAAGSGKGEVLVWDATYNSVYSTGQRGATVWDIDLSPDSSHLVSGNPNTAIIWDVTARGKALALDHDGAIYVTRYSPQGDRIATATGKSVRVWDSNDGQMLAEVNEGVKWLRSLRWCGSYLFLLTKDSKIKKIDAADGSTVSEWQVPDARGRTCIALPQHGKFIAHAAEQAITFWDTATRNQLHRITHGRDIILFVFSSDDSLLAVAPLGSKIIVKELFQSVSDPELKINNNALDAWKRDQLANAEALLSTAVQTSKDTAYYALASRALVRARLGHWDKATNDATQSLNIRRSVVGYIAKCTVLVGKGEKDKGIQVCDIASLRFPSDHVTLLLVKAIVLFMFGDHTDAISRMDDLIVDSTDMRPDPVLYVVQAYMHLLVGNGHFESKDYEQAIQSFENAESKLGNRTRQPPQIVSLVSGWNFDNLAFTIQQRLCEALFAAGHTEEAGEAVRRMVARDTNIPELKKTWAFDFKYRCCSKLEDLGDSAVRASKYDDAVLQYTAALSLGPAVRQHLLMKRSNARMGKHAREDALNDAKEWATLMLESGSWKDALAATNDFRLERFAICQVVCDHLETNGRVADAIACFRRMPNKPEQERDSVETDWTFDFKSRCRRKLMDLGDRDANAKQYVEAVSHYTAAILLDPSNPQDLLLKRSNAMVGKGAREDALNDAKEWAILVLTSGPWNDALAATDDSMPARLTIHRAICERLEATGHVTDAVACFRQIPNDRNDGEQANWTHDFKSRCRRKLEETGDTSTNNNQYDEAVSQYTAALSLDTPTPQDLLLKRSKVYAEIGKWKDALNDANEAIKRDSSSLAGHERMYEALLGMGSHGDASVVFETMFSIMSKSSDPDIRERSRRSVPPEKTKEAIRASIKDAIRDSPLVLINALTGRLCDKVEQAAAFESTAAFTKLIVSMTTHIDHDLIRQVVEEFYRYATFSHTWEGNEPLYENVVKVVVYDLETIPTHEKLQTFCKIVRDAGFNWAWSDTCCINKGDHFVLQEALVSMFKWYEGSAMTIIFLFDVERLAELGALTKSRWNSRGWTFQEYHASKVVRVYTKDWTPYLGLTIDNHKESPQIVSEMENATGISAQALMALRPGLSDIREKLRLASTRQTTRVEDAAYSLLGIFSMTLTVTYGEGDKALGRLLSQLLMSSGDTSILAWTGESNTFNSCLPTSISVFSKPLASHIPPAIPDAEMEAITAGLHASSLDINLVARLYDEVGRLPTPSFVGQRMRLPCLAFKIKNVMQLRNSSEHGFRAKTGALGTVEIRTERKLTQKDSLYLVHPWIDFLLDRRGKVAPESGGDEMSGLVESPSSPGPLNVALPARQTGAGWFMSLGRMFGRRPTPDAVSRSAPATVLSKERQTLVLQFMARLQQPFGALLLEPTRPNAAEYRRVATESEITVRVKEITSATLDELLEGVRVLDVL